MASKQQLDVRTNLVGRSAMHSSTAEAPVAILQIPSQSSGWARQVPGNGSAGKSQLFVALNRRWVHLSYVLVDVLLISFNGLASFYVSVIPLPQWNNLGGWASSWTASIPRNPYVGFLLLYAIVILLCCQSQDLYKTLRGRSAAQESWQVVRAVLLATIIFAAFIFCANLPIVSREVVGISALLNVCTLVMWRVWKRRFVTRRVAQGVGARNALIIGAGNVGVALARYLEANKQFGYHVSGFLDNTACNSHVLGKIDNLARVARAQFVDDIFVTIPSERDLVKKIVTEARQQRLNVKVIPELYDGLASSAPIHHLGDFLIVELHREPTPTANLFVKRLIDIGVSAIALTVLSPVFAVLAVAIKLGSRGPVFYRSTRVGSKGTLFRCYKFRTMVANAEELKERLHHLNERSNGLLFKIANDPRITWLGKFLRRYSLDELPQLWNVLRGDMSLVGPRPPLPTEFDQYSLEHLRRLDVRPGITGLWQVTARQDPSFESYMALDLKYIEHWCLWLDLKILLLTLPVVLGASGR